MYQLKIVSYGKKLSGKHGCTGEIVVMQSNNITEIRKEINKRVSKSKKLGSNVFFYDFKSAYHVKRMAGMFTNIASVLHPTPDNKRDVYNICWIDNA